MRLPRSTLSGYFWVQARDRSCERVISVLFIAMNCLLPDDSSEGENEESSIQRDDLLAMDMGSRRAALQTYIRHAVARVLRRPFDHTSGNCALASLGFDSLMLAELKHTIEAELGISFSL